MNFTITSMIFRRGAVCLAALALISLPRTARSECKEFKIIEYEDRVEAVCVGEPLTEAQERAREKANQEEQKRLEREAQLKKVEEQNRQREEARAAKAKADAEAEGDRKLKNLPPNVAPKQGIDSNKIGPRKF